MGLLKPILKPCPSQLQTGDLNMDLLKPISKSCPPQNATAATLEPYQGRSQYGFVKTHTQTMAWPTPDRGISIWNCLNPYSNHACHEMLLQHYSHCCNIRAVPGGLSMGMLKPILKPCPANTRRGDLNMAF
jgi:hypothetical protein